MRILLCLVMLSVTFTINGQNNSDNRKAISDKINEIIRTGLKIDRDTIYSDTINKFEILLKGSSYLTKTSSQIHILTENPRDLSYLLVYVPYDPSVFSLALHWAKLYKKQNRTFRLIDLHNESNEGVIIEKARFKVKKYGYRLEGEFWAYDTGEFFYILHVFAIKGKWNENIDTIDEIFKSFRYL